MMALEEVSFVSGAKETPGSGDGSTRDRQFQASLGLRV